MKKKEVVRSICFLMIVIAMLFGISELLRDRGATINSFYSEPEDTLSVVIIGGSHVNSAFMPSVLWSDYGIAAHNVYSWNQPIWTSYHYLKETCRTQKPTVAVIELFSLVYGNTYIESTVIDEVNYLEGLKLDYSPNLVQLIYSSWRNETEPRPLSDYINLARYHSRWKYVFDDDFFANPRGQQDTFKGFGFQGAVFGAELPGSDLLVTTSREPEAICVEYLNKIVAFAEQADIQLVFTVTPYFTSVTELEIYHWLEEYAAEKSIPVLNYTQADGQRIGIDIETDLADIGHTNLTGAIKITHDLGRFLAENYTFPDPSTVENYEARNADAAVFNRYLAANEVLKLTELSAYVERGLQDEPYTLIYAGTASDALPEPLLEMLGIGPAQSTFVGTGGQLVDATHYEFFADDYVFCVGTENGVPVIDTGEERFAQSGTVVLLLYDHLMQRPVSLAVWSADSPDELIQHEFTASWLDRIRQ